jgi:hypothetical protein
MSSSFSKKALEVEAHVTEILTECDWKQRRFTCAASGSFHISKTMTDDGEAIALFCDWKHDGPVDTWLLSHGPAYIAAQALHSKSEFDYPEIVSLMASAEDVPVELPASALKEIPFGDGPGAVKASLVSINERIYILGSLEVPFTYGGNNRLSVPVLRKACNRALAEIREWTPPGVIVFPIAGPGLPRTGEPQVSFTLQVAIPMRDDSRAIIKERLANVFRGYENRDKLLIPDLRA